MVIRIFEHKNIGTHKSTHSLTHTCSHSITRNIQDTMMKKQLLLLRLVSIDSHYLQLGWGFDVNIQPHWGLSCSGPPLLTDTILRGLRVFVWFQPFYNHKSVLCWTYYVAENHPNPSHQQLRTRPKKFQTYKNKNELFSGSELTTRIHLFVSGPGGFEAVICWLAQGHHFNRWPSSL